MTVLTLALPLPLESGGSLPRVAGFSIDQTIQMVSDQFEVDLNTTALYRSRDPEAVADLSTGLLFAGGVREIVNHIVGGKIDEWEMQNDPARAAGRIRGRDAMARAIDRPLYVTFVSEYDRRSPAVIARERELMPVALRPIPGVPEPERLVGTWSASAIAKNLAARVGLECAWQAPDYTLLEDIEVAGPPIQTILSLVNPFSQFEPSKVDVYVDGTTLNVRSRPGVDAILAADENNTFSVHDARILSFMIRSRQLDAFRTARVVGSVSNCDANRIVETEETEETSDSINFQKVILKRVVTRTRARYPGPFTLSTKRETYMVEPLLLQLVLVTREDTTNEWDDAVVNRNCKILNTPLQRRATTIKTEFVTVEVGSTSPGGGATRSTFEQETKRFIIRWDYEEDGTLKLQETTEETRYFTNNWIQSGHEIRSYKEIAPGMWQEVIEKFSRTVDNTAWISAGKTVGTASGHRPGGPGLGGPDNFVVQEHFYKVGAIDADGVKDFSLTNDNLPQEAVDLIFAQAAAASGAWEHEMNFTMVNVPWLRRGQVISLTGFTAEDGEPVDIRPALLTEVSTNHREDGPNPTSISRVKAIWWSSS